MQIPLPSKPNIIKSSEPAGKPSDLAGKQDANRVMFEIEGCYPGYGITLGNAFRRVLLSSLPGTAVTGVKIKGVQHEFSTMPHVTEDVIEIILNLKQLRFKSTGSAEAGEKIKLFLKASGEKEVKASDIKAPTGIEIINKNAHIATLTDKKANLEIEMDVETGFGYWSVEQRQKQKLEIGMIPIDAIFSPIRKINFEVENMRVGDRTDYNRLRFDVETDGSITPEEAFKKAAETLVEQLKVFTEVEKREQVKKLAGGEKKEKEQEKEKDDVTKISIDDLKLSARVINALKGGGIKTVGGLIKKSESALFDIEGMGEKGLKEIKRALSKIGLGLK